MNDIVKIFIAYAREDKEYLDELRKHLKPLDRNNIVKIWYDGEIVPGTTWETAIKEALHSADIILLLVSANSLASDYFYDKEVADAIERHKNNLAIVVPIILGHCAWDVTDLINLQALPSDGIPIVEWQPKSKAYADVVRSLKRSIELIHNNRIEAKDETKQYEDLKKKETITQQNTSAKNYSSAGKQIDQKEKMAESLKKEDSINRKKGVNNNRGEFPTNQSQSTSSKNEIRYNTLITVACFSSIVLCYIWFYIFNFNLILTFVLMTGFFGLFAFVYATKLGHKEMVVALIPLTGLITFILIMIIYGGLEAIRMPLPQNAILISTLVVSFLARRNIKSFFKEKFNFF